ncbi:hypothetical protein [Blastococcus sp. TF02-8]|uniref:Rv0361 family membrane protein n=1 Tax=Blastococcus sp. TF02-8 TaxID=2250574 RepID=UPI0011BD8336|nr:hypothetical protein [Blastococcus sp. TF02-8]
MSGPGQHQPQGWGAPPPGYGPAPSSAPPGWGQPVWGPPPWGPPPKRRASRWLTIGLPIGAVVLVAVLGLGYLVFKGVSEGIMPAKRAVDAYATALVEQRWEDAHDQLCESGAREYTPEDLAEAYGDPPLTAYSVDGVNVTWSNGRGTGNASVTLEARGTVRDHVVLPLVEEGEDWRVCP